MAYITKIMLSGIAIKNTGYFDNIKRHCQNNIGSIILFTAPKPEIK